MTHPNATPVTFIVTDIETDGHSPLRNSMLSFASVAVTYDGEVHGEFESVLERRTDRSHDPKTSEWWQGVPEAYKAATSNPKPAETEMLRYADWIETLPNDKVFCVAYSHKAMDDARGCAPVPAKLYELNGQLPKHEITTGA